MEHLVKKNEYENTKNVILVYMKIQNIYDIIEKLYD